MQNSAENYNEKSAAKQAVVLRALKFFELMGIHLRDKDFDSAIQDADAIKAELPKKLRKSFRQNPSQLIAKKAKEEIPEIETLLNDPGLKRIVITESDVNEYPYMTPKRLKATILRNRKLDALVSSELNKFHEKVIDLFDENGLYIPEGDQGKKVVSSADEIPTETQPNQPVQDTYPK